jgi:plasmid replication initiation protein
LDLLLSFHSSSEVEAVRIPEEDEIPDDRSESGPRPLGRDEMNLAEFPFAHLRRQQGDEDSYTYEGSVIDKHGHRQQQRWTVRGAGGLGMPTEYDERVIVALMAISARQGFDARKVPFSVYEILNVMGVSRSQSAYKSVERALERLVGVTIYAEGAFWDNSEKEWITLKSGFHIIEKFWLAYREKNKEVREAEGVPGYFIWSEDIWQSIQDGYIKYLDLDFYFGLDLPLTRRLYRFLDKRMAYQNQYEIDIFDLANRLGMARYQYPSEVVRKLQPALAELIAKGFLAQATDVKVGRYTRMRFERLSPRLGDSEAAAQVAPATEGGERPVDAELQVLLDHGFTETLARQLIERYGIETVQEKVAYLRWETEVRRKRLRSPRGWLRRAIEEDYSAPPGFDPRWWESNAAAPVQLLLDEAVADVEEEDEGWQTAPLEADSDEEQVLWQAVSQEMEGQMTRATFQTLFAQTSLVKVQGEMAVIAVPNVQVQEWLENRLRTQLAEALERQTGRPMTLLFVRFRKG